MLVALGSDVYPWNQQPSTEKYCASWRCLFNIDSAQAATALLAANRTFQERYRRQLAKPKMLLPLPTFEILDSRRLWIADWQDADIVLFDTSRSHYAAWVDEGVLVADVLRPGFAKAVAGTYVILFTRDQHGDDDRCGLLCDTGGPALCNLVDSYVLTSREDQTLMRVDLLKRQADSAVSRVS